MQFFCVLCFTYILCDMGRAASNKLDDDDDDDDDRAEPEPNRTASNEGSCPSLATSSITNVLARRLNANRAPYIWHETV